MSTVEIARRRLATLGVAAPGEETAADVVGRLGAMQSQEFAVAKWSIAQRSATALTGAELDRQFADGVFLRTHVLRPTWHFVSPADIRWLLRLSGPRVHAVNAYYYRKLGVDDEVAATTAKLMVDALGGGNRLTRRELAAVFAKAGIDASGLRMGYLMMRAELDALVCSGGLAGKQHTYALLDERVPDAPELPREEALAELVSRYFTSHGPATVKDFVWWSGLTAADTRTGIEAAGERLRSEDIDGRTYWSGPAPPRPYGDPSPTAHLIQCYDEYVVGYGDSRGAMDVSGLAHAPRADGTFIHAILLDTQGVGFWRRVPTSRSVTVETDLLMPLDDAQRAALDDAVARYGRFVGLPASWR